MESIHTDIRVKWLNIGLMLHYLRNVIFEISVMNYSVFLFSLLRFLTALNVKMCCVFWETGVERLKTPRIPLIRSLHDVTLFNS